MWFIFPYPQDEETPPVDRYLVCGEDYKTIREAVAKTVMEGKVEGLDEACEVMLLLIINFYLGQDFASLCMIS